MPRYESRECGLLTEGTLMNQRDQIKRTLSKQGTAEARFALAGIAVTERHGGRPTAIEKNGHIVFVYPNGTRTSGGQSA